LVTTRYLEPSPATLFSSAHVHGVTDVAGVTLGVRRRCGVRYINAGMTFNMMSRGVRGSEVAVVCGVAGHDGRREHDGDNQTRRQEAGCCH
jgi:hypothetical protein